MFDQIEKLISQYSQEAVAQSGAVPNEKNEEVSQAASSSIIEMLKEKAGSQDFASLAKMFQGEGGATSDLAGDFIQKLTGKGINSQMAATIASAVLPVILSKLTGKAGGTGGLGDILGQLGNLAGKKSANASKSGDLASALGGILGKQSGTAQGKTDLGGALGKLKDLF